MLKSTGLDVFGSRPRHITLATEGGYPFTAGGVSVWCEQLVGSMPEREFQVVALTGSRVTPLAFELPDNVVSVTPAPLWSAKSSGRPLKGAVRKQFREVYHQVLTQALSTRVSGRVFSSVLRDLYDFAQTQNLAAALSSEDAVVALADVWNTNPPGMDDPNAHLAARPTMGDAATVTVLMEHMLRPLSLPAAPTDLVHCASNGLAGLVALGAKWTHGAPFIVSEHGVYLRERYLAHRSDTYGWAVKSALLKVTRAITAATYAEADVVAPGNMYNRRWQVRGGADPDAIVTVYNGVDPIAFAPVPQEPSVPTLVYVGRIDPLKDIETLIRAFSLVLEHIPAARLRLFGVPAPHRVNYQRTCEQLVADLGIQHGVTFEGRAESAREAYASGHVVVLSSISEGFPYTVIESMSTGRATVSTDVGGVSEAVGAAGTVVPARDPRAFADACIRYLEHPELRQRTGQQARARVLDMFTLEHSMSAFRRIYADLLGEFAQPVALTDELADSMQLARSA